MKRNVLQLIDSFSIGGTERQAVQLAGLLKEDATYNVFIGCLQASGPLQQEAERISLAEIPEFRLNRFYDVNFWRQIRKCVRFMKENEIGIVHTHDFYTNVFGMMAAVLAGVPVKIASKRDVLARTSKQLLVERQAFKVSDRILVNADAIRDYLVDKGTPPSKIIRVFNGVDLDRFKAHSFDERSEFLRSLGIDVRDKRPQIVTIVANMRSEVKNHEMFLRSAARVGSAYKDVVFMLAGEGELSERLQAFAHEVGIGDRTFFLGRVQDVPRLLSFSDVCTLTSRTEGFPNSILEYMAAGKPVVATAVGGAPEVIVDGETGFLVSSDDFESAADHLLALLQEPLLARRLGHAARRRVEQRYSLRVKLGTTLELYDGLLSAKRRISARERI